MILPNGNHEESASGVPQGGPLSPLLANILLDDLDKELEKRGHAFVRYADDFVILCHSRKAAVRVLAGVTQFLSQRLKLIVNEAKSQVVKLSEASFLGLPNRAPENPVDSEQEPKEVQSQSPRPHQTNARSLAKQSARGPDALPTRSHELLRLRHFLRRSAST